MFDRPRENQVIYEEIEWHDPRRRPYLLRNREYIAQISPLEGALTEERKLVAQAKKLGLFAAGAAGSMICTWQAPGLGTITMRVRNSTGGLPVLVVEVQRSP